MTESLLDFEPATVEDLTHTGELVKAAGGRWVQHVADQRNIDEVRAAADGIVDEWGGVDVLFANAGIQAFKPLLDVSDAHWHDQLVVFLASDQAAMVSGTSFAVTGGDSAHLTA
jgi:NAD(P)-dependent dehydrogenase (short-subunit alcohol dehydrogenase family)